MKSDYVQSSGLNYESKDVYADYKSIATFWTAYLSNKWRLNPDSKEITVKDVALMMGIANVAWQQDSFGEENLTAATLFLKEASNMGAE